MHWVHSTQQQQQQQQPQHNHLHQWYHGAHMQCWKCWKCWNCICIVNKQESCLLEFFVFCLATRRTVCPHVCVIRPRQYDKVCRLGACSQQPLTHHQKNTFPVWILFGYWLYRGSSGRESDREREIAANEMDKNAHAIVCVCCVLCAVRVRMYCAHWIGFYRGEKQMKTVYGRHSPCTKKRLRMWKYKILWECSNMCDCWAYTYGGVVRHCYACIRLNCVYVCRYIGKGDALKRWRRHNKSNNNNICNRSRHSIPISM